MKHIQGKKTIGYAVLLIKGSHIERFLEHCVNEDIPIWDIQKQKNEDQYCISIYIHHIKKIKEINKHFTNPYDISVIKKKGLSAFVSRLLQKRHVVVATIISFITLFLLSNLIWSVNIKGVSHEIEEKITEELVNHGVKLGSFNFSLKPIQSIQQTILNDIPELLWLGIEKKGTSFHIEGIEKKLVEDKQENTPQHLIAKKSGVIEHMYIRQGLPLVHKNDYVQKGDLLVSGIIQQDEPVDDESEEKEEKKYEPIKATGEVFANTWYEVGVTIPLNINYDTLTGRDKTSYKLNIGNLSIPIWGIRKPEYKAIYKEEEKRDLYFLNWKLPFKIIYEKQYELERNEMARSREEALDLGVKQVNENLKRQLGDGTEILSNFTLHEAVHNGKVKLNLYVSVLENIALEEQIEE